jgi:hypothetical protein
MREGRARLVSSFAYSSVLKMEAKYSGSPFYLLQVHLFFGSFFDLEDGRDMFL